MQIKESSDIATSSELALVDGMLTFGDILSDSSSIQGVEAQVVALTTATLETITSISVSDESTLGKRVKHICFLKINVNIRTYFRTIVKKTSQSELPEEG
jgi:hypothetical protein